MIGLLLLAWVTCFDMDAGNDLGYMHVRAASMERGDLVRDVPYRVYKKLGDIVFASNRENAVYVVSGSFDSAVSSAMFMYNWRLDMDVERPSIHANSVVLQYTGAQETAAVMPNHMVRLLPRRL